MVPVLIDRHGGEHPDEVLFVRSLDELDVTLGLAEGNE
jgi:hypothetical protein